MTLREGRTFKLKINPYLLPPNFQTKQRKKKDKLRIYLTHLNIDENSLGFLMTNNNIEY